MAAAAFFDLDRTLLRRSSALALAGSFRERGLISRRQLAKAAAWQLLFVLRGASHEAVRRAAEDGLVLLRGFTPAEMRDLVAEAMEPVLQPLVYAEPLDGAAAHLQHDAVAEVDEVRRAHAVHTRSPQDRAQDVIGVRTGLPRSLARRMPGRVVAQQRADLVALAAAREVVHVLNRVDVRGLQGA